jgi:L1 cell adhesion molecule like protein
MEGKISQGDKDTVISKVNEVESWISSNHNAETEEYEAKQKEL